MGVQEEPEEERESEGPVAYSGTGEPIAGDTTTDEANEDKGGPGLLGRILGVGGDHEEKQEPEEPEANARAPEGTAEPEPESPAAEPSPAPEPAGEGLDLNKATFEDLRELGFSVTQATRVITYRDRQSGFDSLEDLEGVPGMPREFLREIEPRLRLG